MQRPVKIGTRDSQLAVWQSMQVLKLLKEIGIESELLYIKSEGDVNTITPLYEIGVEGIFTRTLDIALLEKQIDIAVHSMKDVPVQLAQGIQQVAVLKRGSWKDIVVYKHDTSFLDDLEGTAVIATSSIRRRAQWLHRYPNHIMANLRGNVNTRLKKLSEENWNAAIFAAAGLERINIRPENSIDLDWMLPAPAQGAIMVVSRVEDEDMFTKCKKLNDEHSALCARIERDFLKELLGGCSTPISALATIESESIRFRGNVCSPDGKMKIDIEKKMSLTDEEIGRIAAKELLEKNNVRDIIYDLKHDK